MKSIQIGKEEVEIFLLAEDMILYIENPKDSRNKLLGLISAESLKDTKINYISIH